MPADLRKARDIFLHAVGKLPLPRFPGRGLLLDLASGAVLTALVATAGGALADLLDVRVPAQINYRGMIRNRTLSGLAW